MNAADGDRASSAALASAAAAARDEPFPRWPAPVREAWNSGLELLLEANPAPNDREKAALLLHLAAIEYDTPAFRDALSSTARLQFTAYADPAGLIQALGILEARVPMQTVHRRWRVFEELKPHAECLHPAYGVGVVQEIDSLSNEVSVRFDRVHRIPLDLAVQALHVLKPASTLAQWRADTRALNTEQVTRPQIMERGRDVVPATTDTKVLHAILVPAVLSESRFHTVMSAADEAVGTTAPGDAAQPQQRTVAEARSAEELCEVMRQTGGVAFTQADCENVRSILSSLAERQEQPELFRDLVVETWLQADGADWLRSLLTNLAPSAAPWSDCMHYALLTDGLSGKDRLPAWLEASAAALDLDRFCQLGAHLPHRRWGTLERVVAQVPGGPASLLKCVLAHVKAGEATADMVVWLWKRGGDINVLHDPTVILRALARPVKGPYIKAHRDLRRLIIHDDSYHTFLLEDADRTTMESVVRTIDHTLVLDHGERQTLLVRLTRLFPDLRAVIERGARGRQNAPAARKQGPVTSHRSYHRAWRELRSIVEVKIPANSRAIAHARSYGDLRENAEYKAAKEEQGLLARKRGDLEKALDRVKPLDFSVVTDFSRVIPGCTVAVRRPDGKTRSFHVLGLWDSDPERHMISFDTPIGKALHGHRVGDIVESPMGPLEITDIRPLDADMIAWLNSESD